MAEWLLCEIDRSDPRECLAHVVVFRESHLRDLLRLCKKYYNECTIYRSLAKDPSLCRAGQVSVRIAVSPYSKRFPILRVSYSDPLTDIKAMPDRN